MDTFQLVTLKRRTVVVLLNLLSGLTYSALASRCWVDPILIELGGGAAGSGLRWCLTALPSLLACTALTLGWFFFQAAKPRMYSPSQLAFVAVSIALFWWLIVGYDLAHRGT
jgi:hypothetical protein